MQIFLFSHFILYLRNLSWTLSMVTKVVTVLHPNAESPKYFSSFTELGLLCCLSSMLTNCQCQKITLIGSATLECQQRTLIASTPMECQQRTLTASITLEICSRPEANYHSSYSLGLPTSERSWEEKPFTNTIA